MLEIIAIILLSEKISNKARQKGYPKTGRYVLLFLVFWFSFEFIGAIIGYMFSPKLYVYYPIALIFAIIGYLISSKIVNSLKQKEIKTDYDPDIVIELPFKIKVWKDNIIQVFSILILCIVISKIINVYIAGFIFIILVLVYAKYEVVFNESGIIIKYLYGRKQKINKEYIRKLLLNNKLMIEVGWKKNSKDTTKTRQFSANAFILHQIPIENIKRFLETYKQ